MPFEHAERLVNEALAWLRLGIEVFGALVIAVGVAIAIVRFASEMGHRTGHGYAPVRRTLARYLAVGLEFQLASDVIATAVAPTWDAIGKLAAIAVIRTVLNYFLEREMKVMSEERERGTGNGERE